MHYLILMNIIIYRVILPNVHLGEKLVVAEGCSEAPVRSRRADA